MIVPQEHQDSTAGVFYHCRRRMGSHALGNSEHLQQPSSLLALSFEPTCSWKGRRPCSPTLQDRLELVAAQPPFTLSVLAKAAHRAVVLLLSLARADCRQKPLQSTKPVGQDICLQVTLGGAVLELPATHSIQCVGDHTHHAISVQW